MKSFHCRCLGSLLPLLLLVLPACQRPEEPPQPADLVPKERMTALLTDLHILEARLENSRLSPDSSRSLYLSQHKLVMKNLQVTDSAFHRSYRYYSIHGKDLDNIYKVVIDTLKARENRLEPSKTGLLTPPPPIPQQDR
ncbi:DUF4296 domain-containing protein [Hymenobacter glacialis]|uniref:DUF4296 domain-containing protein n=1 Tax=Hymenobacter glacialis TaxID=1908236 RepID=A0A1G1T4M8_9BACT|nr:DUF4296 domain-containing protein [Hymenobacter glacialis]OGX85830.1 hypothetical protein BEN48_14085 [Hymenobacter glacialis]